MRKEDIRLDLLITKVIISPGRYLLMKHNRLVPDLLLYVPTKLLLASGWTHQKCRINHRILHLKCLVMVGLILKDLKNPLSCPSSTLMTFWGRLSCFLWMRNKSLASKDTHPVDARVEQDVTPCKLSWMISINVTTRIYFVKRLKRLNNQTRFD